MHGDPGAADDDGAGGQHTQLRRRGHLRRPRRTNQGKMEKKTSFANKNQNVKIFIGQYFVYKSQLEILKKDERRE